LEIEDQAWCPRAVRDGITDYLQFALTTAKPYEVVIPRLAEALRSTRTNRVVDLCSGAAGPWLWLQPTLAQQGLQLSICLTDRYPNLDSLPNTSNGNPNIRYHREPIEATQIPPELTGFRTLFTAFHHFRPEQARAILADAVRRRQGIAVFEASERRWLALLLLLPLPLVIWLTTPFIRPFRWSRLLWTYLIPLVPLVTLFDGMISCLRTYNVEELRQLIKSLQPHDYQWDIGTLKGRGNPIAITYLIGVPGSNGTPGPQTDLSTATKRSPAPLLGERA
jgi:hypothetical protein